MKSAAGNSGIFSWILEKNISFFINAHKLKINCLLLRAFELFHP